ncbi:hypothetical protein EGM_12260 [Macaca fascicularis]|uniref:Uncharacterized protein n=1 Tax=Macaca fascicularis TaxID=9541 RepID=G7P1M3_MACFA|nr:hypothetical protein EGM_12260 [Macaca fascicularis]
MCKYCPKMFTGSRITRCLRNVEDLSDASASVSLEDCMEGGCLATHTVMSLSP